MAHCTSAASLADLLAPEKTSVSRAAATLMLERSIGSILPSENSSVRATLLGLAILMASITAASAEMPKDFQGTWCTSSNTLKDDWHAYSTEGADCDDANSVEITATKVIIPALSVSCVVRQATKFDVCPYGMIFRNRERARVLRPFQINPWSPDYHIARRAASKSRLNH
jgi:hypothetical protein